jgi:Uma2 family endonuclease
MDARSFSALVPVPLVAIRLPLELPLPDGFAVGRPETWPLVDGDLEFVDGKLFYMPPSADRQQDTTADVVAVLAAWRKTHRAFVLATNEAGMLLGGDARGADVAVWRKRDALPRSGNYRHSPPVLAVEVQGELENEASLRAKAAWYLAHGVEIVWLLLPRERRVVVSTAAGSSELRSGDQLPAQPSLPGLSPRVDELFEQLDEADSSE